MAKSHYPDDPKWHPDFSPSFTPKQMIDMGVFEGIYTHAIEGIPGSWRSSSKVLDKGSDPNPELNYYRVKSRQSLKEWQDKGWTTEHSPLGWWQWYCLYFLGRRIDKEDETQIKRWRSFVARHQGQVTKACSLNDSECHTKQRQALLQWAWDSTTKFTNTQREKNVKVIARAAGCSIGDTPATETHILTLKTTTW